MAEQPYFPGTEPPGRHPDIERCAATWHEAKIAQKRAAATTKQAHAALVLQIQHAGLELYPWTNPDTGRKRNIVITREPKAKEQSAPRSGGGKRGRRRDVEPGDALERAAQGDNRVEKRRVPRAAEHDKLADPFGATREKMDAASARSKAKRGKKR